MKDFIGYDNLSQAAMRGVVREALRNVEANCQMPGDHRFFITFLTRAPGVKIADYLIEQFPHDITIVVQHQFWDLEVHPDHFELILKFSGVPQHLSVPFAAVTRFADPSVKFGLAFEPPVSGETSVIAPAMEAVSGMDNVSSESMPDTANEGTVVKLDAFRRK
ncbi:MAG: ClpXP protease specificity-enhancing factor SspB [Pseudomonadota bacterium]